MDGVDVRGLARSMGFAVTAARQPIVAHLTTIDMSLLLLLRVELETVGASGCEVLGISAPGELTPELSALGVRPVPIDRFTRSWSLSDDLAAACNLWRILRTEQPDVLHTHTPKPGILGRILGRLSGVPIVVNTCHGLWAVPGDPIVKRLFVTASEAIAARFSDAELFQNPEDLAALRPYLSSRKLAKVVGNGTDLRLFVRSETDRARIRTELNITDDQILVLAVGRRVDEKGVREFADAASALANTDPRAVFVWVGPSDSIRGRSVDDVESAPVLLAGHQTNMCAWYSAADVFVLPSYREGLPRSAMEAAACGLPLVLTNIRGSREIGTDDREVLFVPAADSHALAAAIGRLVADTDLRTRLGKSAEQRARAVFDQRRVAHCSLATYRDVAAVKVRGTRGKRRRELLEHLPMAQFTGHEPPRA